MVPVVPQPTTVVAAPCNRTADRTPSSRRSRPTSMASVTGRARRWHHAQPPRRSSAPVSSPTPDCPVPLSESRPAAEALAQNDAFCPTRRDELRRPLRRIHVRAFREAFKRHCAGRSAAGSCPSTTSTVTGRTVLVRVDSSTARWDHDDGLPRPSRSRPSC